MCKLLFILPDLNSGGAERVAINYLRQLDLDKYDVTLVVIQKTGNLLWLVPSGVQLIDLQAGRASRSFWPLLRLLRQLRPDVVFTTHSRIATLLMLIKSFVPKFRHLARMQNTPSLEKKYAAYGLVKQGLYALGFQNANVVIAQTDAMKEDGIKLFGLKPDRVRVLSNPIDTSFIDNNLERAQSPFLKGQISAVASGRLAYQKAFDVLISALPSVLEKYPNFVLHILGTDDGEGEKLRNLMSELGLEKYINFIGFQSNPYPYYAFCDLFILSSRWEGFPNVLLENYYLNTPIVATRCVPAVKKLVQNGANGYLCEPDNMESLSAAICKTIALKRPDIKNPSYNGGMLEEIL